MHPRLAGRHLDDAGNLGLDGPGRQSVEQLIDDLGRLASLLQAYPVPSERVAVGVGPHLPVSVLPCQRIVLVASQVPVDAAGPGVRTRQAVLHGDVARDHPDPPRARLEDGVGHEQRLELVAEVTQLLHDPLALVDPALGKVVFQATDAVEVGVEPTARHCFHEVEDVLAVAEGEENRRDGTELHPHIAQKQGHVGDASHFEEDRAQVLSPLRSLDAHQLLGGQDEGHLVGEVAEPVDAVHQRGDLRIGANLAQLLVAPVHVARRRVGPHDLLAVEPDDDAKRAVGGRVLRPDVEGHPLGLQLDVHPGIGRLPSDVRGPLPVGLDAHASAPSVSLSPSGSPGRPSTSTRPGQGLTSRARSGKSLRNGVPSNSPGRYR